MKKIELQNRIEELEGKLIALEDKFDMLKTDVHNSRNPYNNTKRVMGCEIDARGRVTYKYVTINA